LAVVQEQQRLSKKAIDFVELKEHLRKFAKSLSQANRVAAIKLASNDEKVACSAKDSPQPNRFVKKCKTLPGTLTWLSGSDSSSPAVQPLLNVR
jgi:hypothetical protein